MTAHEARIQAVGVTVPGRAIAAFLALAAAVLAIVAAADLPPAGGTTSPAGSALPLPAQARVSAELGRADPAYRATAAGASVRVANSRHGLSATFDARGRASVGVGEGAVALSLDSIGHGTALRGVPAVAPRASANRVEYRRGDLTEWYVNGPAGLEHGFTLGSRPRSGAAGPLTLSLAVDGDARVDRGGDGLSFGGTSLVYRGLWAADATGRELPAWLEPRAGGVLVRVDDRGARYPVTVDPFFQAGKLRASDRDFQDALGTSVAVSGATVVAGAPNDDGGRGSVYVFTRGPNGWVDGTETAKLTAISNDRMAGDHLGERVAISGDTVVASAPDKNLGHPGQGAVYVFVKPPGGWSSGTTTARLFASDRVEGDQLGTSVAVSGDTIVAGAPRGFGSPGAAYVFVRPPSGWTSASEAAKLTLNGSPAGRFFGNSVGVSGDTVVVGAPLESNRGAAYVFVRPAGGWANMTETARLAGSDSRLNDEFGRNVAIDGNTIAVAAHHFDTPASDTNDDIGAVYVFVKPAAGWANATQTARLTASAAATGDNLGDSVAVSGASVVAGVPGDDVGSNFSQGAAYVFVRPARGWTNMTQTTRLVAADGGNDLLGTAVGVSANTVVAATTRPDEQRGALYVFENDATAPAAPTLRGTNVGGASNANTVRVRGTAEAGSTVRIYGNGACSGTPLATGGSAAFASPGLTVTLPDDSRTTLRATATDRAGNVSACSGNSLVYLEDSRAPAAPVLAATDPASPGNVASVRVSGAAEGRATVRVYAGTACAGAPVASGSAEALAGGFAVAIARNAVTTFRATATDAVGNTSACSDPISFLEDSTAPAPPTISGPASVIVGDVATFVATAADAGTGVAADAIRWTPSDGLPAARGASISLTFERAGVYTVSAVAADRAGNMSAEASHTVKVDLRRLSLQPVDRWAFLRGGATGMSRLTVRKVAAGATLTVRCSGASVRKGNRAKRDCPFRTRVFKPSTKIRDINVAPAFKGRRLKAGTTIELRLTATGALGRIARFRMRSGVLPKFTVLCQPPGGRAGKC